ncbi:MAG: hypothetical protein ACOCXH_10320, partial [Cyclobacteriaceae bacterium]
MKSLILCIFILLFFACKPEIKNRIEADFSKLEEQLKEKKLQYEGAEAGGGAAVENEIISKENLEYSIENEKILLNLIDSSAEIRLVASAIGLPDSWQHFTFLEINLTNRSTTEVDVLTVLWCPRGRLPDTLNLQPGETAAFSINLLDLPLIGSVRQKYQVNQIALNFSTAETPAQVEINSMALLETSREKPMVVVDKFGQRVNSEWPNKIKNVEDLKKNLKEESDTLNNYFDQVIFDQYFGYKGVEKYEATGFFYLHNKIENGDTTWFFVTPEGYPFWSVGVTGIRPKKPRHAVTLIKGNEQLFHELPDENGPYGSAYIDSTF